MSDPQQGTLSNDELIAKLRWTKSEQFVARQHPWLRLRLRLRAKPRLLSGFDRSPHLASSAPGSLVTLVSLVSLVTLVTLVTLVSLVSLVTLVSLVLQLLSFVDGFWLLGEF